MQGQQKVAILFDNTLSSSQDRSDGSRFPQARNRRSITLAVDDRSLELDRFIDLAVCPEYVGLTYHAHVSAKIRRAFGGDNQDPLVH